MLWKELNLHQGDHVQVKSQNERKAAAFGRERAVSTRIITAKWPDARQRALGVCNFGLWFVAPQSELPWCPARGEHVTQIRVNASPVAVTYQRHPCPATATVLTLSFIQTCASNGGRWAPTTRLVLSSPAFQREGDTQELVDRGPVPRPTGPSLILLKIPCAPLKTNPRAWPNANNSTPGYVGEHSDRRGRGRVQKVFKYCRSAVNSSSNLRAREESSD